MSEPLHDIDQLFHDNIEGHTEYPPQSLWEKIEADLDKKTAVVYRKKYEKIKRTAILLLFIISGILLYEIFTYHSGNDIARNDRKTTTVRNIPAIPENEKKSEQSKDDIEPAGPEKNTLSPVEANQGKKAVSQPQQGNDNVDKKNTGKVDLHSVPDGNLRENRIIYNTIAKSLANKKYIGKSTEKITAETNVMLKEKLANKTTAIPSADKESVLSSSATQKYVFRLTPPVGEKSRYLSTISKLSFLTTQSPGTTLNIDNTAGLSSIALAKVSEKQISRAARKASSLKNMSKPGFSLSFTFSPNVAWNSLRNDEPHRSTNGRVEDHHEIERGEHNNFSYTGGLKLGYTFNKNWSIQTGLTYTSVIARIAPKLIFADRDNNGNIRYRLDCSSGYTFLLPEIGSSPNAGDSLKSDNSRNSLSYAGIPLIIEYKLLAGKFSLSALAGGQVNVLLKGKTTTVLSKGATLKSAVSGNTEALKPAYFSLLTGISGEMKLNKNFSVMLTPAVQFGISPINKGASVRTRSNYFGIGAGVKLRL